jgi:hypothetical protein
MSTIEPVAGFPPIIPISTRTNNNNKVRKRSFDPNTIINISDILQKKRSTPFITMSGRKNGVETETDINDGGYLSQSSVPSPNDSSDKSNASGSDSGSDSATSDDSN